MYITPHYSPDELALVYLLMSPFIQISSSVASVLLPSTGKFCATLAKYNCSRLPITIIFTTN